jgi:hypothetical protein
VIVMLGSEELSLLWMTQEAPTWRPFTGTHVFVGIVKSFDPKGFLKLEVSRDDMHVLASEGSMHEK